MPTSFKRLQATLTRGEEEGEADGDKDTWMERGTKHEEIRIEVVRRYTLEQNKLL